MFMDLFNRDKGYLQDIDSDLVENDFDSVDLFAERIDEEDNGHTLDNVEL